MDYGHHALGAHVSGLLPCGSPWEGTGGARGMIGFFRLAIFSSTRVIVWVSVHTSIRLVRRTNCSSLSAENSIATNLTPLGPLPDLSRSTAFHFASRSFNHHHVRSAINYSAAYGFAVNTCHSLYRGILCCRSHCTAADPPTLLLPIHHIARPFTASASTARAPQL